MAKAVFHKNQRVYVKPVGTYAIIERVIPQWVKGMDEPLRVFYDAGLGREFAAAELLSEDAMKDDTSSESDVLLEIWRIQRAKNRWGTDTDNRRHPFPGSFPVVLTDENDWGGWRVPSAEYDRDPHRIEHQARIIANSVQMMSLIKRFTEYVGDAAENATVEMQEMSRHGTSILRNIYDVPETLPNELAAE